MCLFAEVDFFLLFTLLRNTKMEKFLGDVLISVKNSVASGNISSKVYGSFGLFSKPYSSIMCFLGLPKNLFEERFHLLSWEWRLRLF